MIKGSDPLCPLGFHPQVRWPTRCKRCFREYSQHKVEKKNGRNAEPERRVSDGWSGSLADSTSTGYGSIASAYDSAPPRTNLGRLSSKSSMALTENNNSDWRQSTPQLSADLTNYGRPTRNSSPTRRDSKPKTLQIESFKEVPSMDDNPDVAFIIKVKSSAPVDSDEDADDETSIYTDATDATLRDPLAEPSDLELRKEVEQLRQRCLTLERDKKELVNIRTSSRSSSEMFRLKREIEEQKEVIKSLEHKKVKVERESMRANAQAHEVEALRDKLSQSQTLVEKLMEADIEHKRQIETLESEMEEMRDTIREEEVDAYQDIKKELEQTARNCRILQFKLRSAERKAETIQLDKESMQKKLIEVQDTPVNRGKETRMAPPTEEASSLLRDLNEALERESDMREQLKFSEDEASTLRIKLSRLEEDNESMSIQLKKIATSNDKPISMALRNGHDNDDVTVGELKLQLELNDQEAALMRKKVEELESERTKMGKELKELRDKVTMYDKEKEKSLERRKDKTLKGKLKEEMETLEAENADLRRKLIDKERESEGLHAELTVKSQRKGSLPVTIGPQGRLGMMQRSKSLDSEAVDIRKQMQIIEQEGSLLRLKSDNLEKQNERLIEENRRLNLRISKKPLLSTKELELIDKQVLQQKVNELEEKLKQPNEKLVDLEGFITKESHNEEVEQLMKEIESFKNNLTTKEEELKTNVTKSEVIEKKVVEAEKKATDAEKEKKSLKDEVKQLKNQVNRMLEGTKYESRSTTKATPTSTKQELKKIVEELEQEISVIYTKLQTEDVEKLQKELDNYKQEINKTNEDIKKKEDHYKKEIEEVNKRNEELNLETKKEKERADKVEKEKKKIEKEKLTIEKEKEKADIEKAKIQKEKETLDKEKQVLEKEKEVLQKEKQELEKEHENKIKEAKKSKKDEDLQVFKQRIEALKKDLSTEKEKRQATESKLSDLEASSGTLDYSFEQLRKTQEEKHTLQQQLQDSQDKVEELEKKVTETEDKTKSEKKKNKDLHNKISALERDLNNEKEKNKTTDKQQKDVTTGWQKEKTELKNKIEELNITIKKLQDTVITKEQEITEKEKNLKEERQKSIEADKKMENNNEKQKKEMQMKLKETETKLTKTEKDLKCTKDKLQKNEAELKKEKEENKNKIIDLETEIKTESKKKDKLERDLKNSLKEKDEEIAEWQHKISQLEVQAKVNMRVENQEQLQQAIEALEEQLGKEHQEYEDLTAKYELLEEDYVMIKARLVMEKEQVESNYDTLKRDYDTVDGELKTLRETYNLRQDTWIKEKLDLQERLKESEAKLSRENSGRSWDSIKIQHELEEKSGQLEQLKKEESMLRDQLSMVKRESDEYRRQLDDYDQIAKIQARSLSIDTTNIEKEVRDLRNRLQQEEKAHKGEIASIKMNHESKEALLKEEVAALQMQSGKFRRERDTYRDMMEGAQKTIAELKSDTVTHQYVGGDSEKQELEDKVRFLQEQLSSAEDRLAEVRMENIRTTTERTTDRVNWECKMAHLQTRLNELEEDKLMASGRTRLVGAKTRLELAWQKERKDHLKLLDELTDTNKNLQERVLDLEKDKDFERRDSSRKLEDIRTSVEEEKKEARQAIKQLQHDVVTLRDAQSKSRMLVDRMKRERERVERDRDELKGRNVEMAEQLFQVEEQISYLKDLLPKLQAEQKKTSNKGMPMKQEPMQSTKSGKELLDGLDIAYKILRDDRARREFEETQTRPAKRQVLPYRRTVSAGPEELPVSEDPIQRMRGNIRSKVLPAITLTPSRRAVSYEQDIDDPNADLADLWQNDDAGSASSIQSYGGYGRYLSSDREPSTDRGSTKSEIATQTKEKKKKKGIVGKIKSLTKSRSTDETEPEIVPGGYHAMYGYESDASVDEEGKKKTVKSKIASVFSSKKSHSRPQSLDRDGGLERSRQFRLSPSPEPPHVSMVRPLSNRRRMEDAALRRQGSGDSQGSTDSYSHRLMISRQASTESAKSLRTRQKSVETEV